MKLFNKILLNLFFVLIIGCGGGENNTPELIPSAPTPETPSMTMALEKYIKQQNKK